MAYESNRDVFDSGFLSHKGDFDSRIRQTKIDRRYMYEDFTTGPWLSASTPLSGAAVSTTSERLVGSAFNQFRISPLGVTQTLLAPFKATEIGWDVAHDLTENDGWEMIPAGALSTDCPHVYKVGTEAFFGRWKFTPADASGSEMLAVGFRKQAAFGTTIADPPTLGDYTDYATIGLRGTANPNTIKIASELNNSGESLTDTTMTWADAATKILTVKVSLTGVVTYEVEVVGTSASAAPTQTATLTLDTGDIMIPFVRHVFGATTPGSILIKEWECGVQPSSRVTLI